MTAAAPPANAAAAVIDVVVGEWRRGTRYACRAASCGKGKFRADTSDQRCPKCGQPHQVRVQM